MSNRSVPIIDATIFLGMNHDDSLVRDRCVSIISSFFSTGLELNLEQVGICDRVIWGKCREHQDVYYPFMDQLHTLMPFHRVPYLRNAHALAVTDERFNSLPICKAVLAAHVFLSEKTFYTLDESLLDLKVLHPFVSDLKEEDLSNAPFPQALDVLYRRSLKTKVKSEEFFNG